MSTPIGIITGSGPEAGIDLWQKVLAANASLHGEHFTGDLCAPDVTILSVPELGYSMELEKNWAMVWEVLKKSAERIARQTEYYAIACNTLNVYAPQLKALQLDSQLLSTRDVVEGWLKKNRRPACILGALPVVSMGRFSVFAGLDNSFAIETPHDVQELQQLIYDIKRLGGKGAGLARRFEKILQSVQADDIFLACTELPLLSGVETSKNLIDVTDLLARRLAEKGFSPRLQI